MPYTRHTGTCLSLALAAVLSLGSTAQASSAMQRTQSLVHKEISQSVAAQKRAEAWAAEKEALLANQRELAAQEDWLTFRCQKYEAYIAAQKKSIAELERRKTVFARIERELEPFLDQTATRIGQLIEHDLPFLKKEREQRLRFLQDSLNDYHLPLSEKLRRVMEALQVEAEYGHGLSATETLQDIDGAKRQGTLLRLGRVAQFFRSADGTLSCVWDKTSSSWEKLDTDAARSVQQGIDIAMRRRPAGLLLLPLGVTE
ncbi:DUF3450 domain-containing protein [Desulfobaculum bizertense]|uniref:DUF3450 domain-containing protein n=1 Tax=Desulfobaculum bizertense DSM 18034 TaxID=1121442 RepID=A0A1T4VGZ1_9BACT|nr:DUF3450 domain-containing protein [Desulfobaculum bizertense]UIJ37818.1 DUF3450 domain-containing protein [Desulfobaculum bizertense]SKA64206.1 Protein of unknown function [Desulfobaculum bizertense DSM 18034]